MWPLTGQDRVVSYLKRSLENGTLSHAYLLTGPRRVGKMTLAITLAQAVNCAAGEKPCGECASCRRIAAEQHPDVQVLRLLSADEADDKKAKSELVIEQVRKLRHSASLPPYEGRCRVYIFEQAELLNEEAANCLLKTLEEPLPDVLFILITPDKKLLPETVVSRCQHIGLMPVPVAEIEDLLLCRGLAPSKAALVANLAKGSPGWAINTLEHEEVLQEREILLKQLLDLISQGYDQRFEAAETLAGKGAQAKNDLSELLRLWQELWRDLLLTKAGRPDAVSNIDLQARLDEISSELNLDEIRVFINRLPRAIEQAGSNVNPRLILEVLMLDMPRVDKARMKR